MPAIKVRAMSRGTYGGHLRQPGDVFFLVDVKDPKTGKIKHAAEQALAIEGEVEGGWMERVDAKAATETPAQIKARESREAQEDADRQAKIAAGVDPDAPEEVPAEPAKPGQGMQHKAKPGSNAGENSKGSSQSANEVI